jgi:hypothetical protein
VNAPPRDSRARIVELVAMYRSTCYDIRLTDGSIATLRVGEPAPPTLAHWLGSDGFALYLTACNPYSIALTAAQNHARLARLRERLRAIDARWLEGDASSPDGGWTEPSLLVSGVPASVCDTLAFAFEQNGGLGVNASGSARLRIYRNDWRCALDAAADIDWVER